MPVPTVSFIGYSGSGKTSLIEKVVPELKKSGLKVAVVKHAAHGFNLDHPGTDSWRHRQSGSDVVVLTSPGQVVMMENTPDEPDLGVVLENVRPKVDMILVEGYKKAKLPKIEVRAGRNSPGLPCAEEDLLAIITGELVSDKAPRFSEEDVELIVRRLVAMVTRSPRQRTA